MRRLARRGAVASLKRTVEKSRPEDIAEAIGHLAPHEQKLVFAQVVENETAANVLTQLDASDVQLLAAEIDFDRLVLLMNAMEVDDEADLIQLLPEDIRDSRRSTQWVAWGDTTTAASRSPSKRGLRNSQR